VCFLKSAKAADTDYVIGVIGNDKVHFGDSNFQVLARWTFNPVPASTPFPLPDEILRCILFAHSLTLGNSRDEHRIRQVVEEVFCPEHVTQFAVEIISGQHLAGMDVGGKSDPYVEITTQKHMMLEKKKKPYLYKTATKTSTINPTWNERFILDFAKEEKCVYDEPELLFNLWDKDFGSADDRMGVAHFNLLTQELPFDGSIPVELKDKHAGTIAVRIAPLRGKKVF